MNQPNIGSKPCYLTRKKRRSYGVDADHLAQHIMFPPRSVNSGGCKIDDQMRTRSLKRLGDGACIRDVNHYIATCSRRDDHLARPRAEADRQLATEIASATYQQNPRHRGARSA